MFSAPGLPGPFQLLRIAGRVLAVLFCLLTASIASAAPSPSRPLRVVMDDNYPPYVMRDAHGVLQGYLVDAWQLWAKKTGVAVEIIGQDWAMAQKTMAAGQAEVIDTIFRTPQREQSLDFSKPYATLPVAIYIDTNLSGIPNLAGLQGFQVGVKAGDACQDRLVAGGVDELIPYPGYQALLQAALAGRVHVFCMDEAPANYLIFHAKAERHIRKAFTVYSGEFHRAVRKGDVATLALVERGFAAMTATERQALRDKWLGQDLSHPHPLQRSLIYGLAIAALIIVLLLTASIILQRMVKRRTAALMATSDQLHATLDALPDLMFELDLNGRYLSCHSPRSELLATPAEVLMGKRVLDVWPAEAAEICMSALREAHETGSSHGKVFVLDLADGKHWFELSTARKSMPGGQAPHFVMLSRDITRRQIAEAAAQRQSRLYAALSQCNQAIVRSANEAELFPQICRDAVDFGAMKMAWIGLLDEAGKFIRPVASFGAGIEYLDGIGISLAADQPSGQGPTGTAMREDRPYWCQDFRHDPATMVWHERGARFGWGASAALPLHRQGRVVGVFNLYADEAGSFDEAARDLLTEMAMDIDYALDSYDREAARQHALAALADSRNLLQTIIDTAPVRVFWKDLSLCFMGCNPLFAHDAGLASPAELIGKDDFAMGWHEQAERYRADDRAVMASGVAKLAYDEPQTTPDGKTIWLRTYKVPLRNSAQAIIGLLGLYEDITEHKLAELALRDETTLRRQMMESLPGIFYMFNQSGHFLAWNKNLEKVTQRSAEEIAHSHPLDLIAAADKESVAARIRQTFAMGEASLDASLTAKDGAATAFYLTGKKIEANGEAVLIGIGIDITERNRMADSLLKLSLAVEQSPNTIVITDLDAHIEYVNAAFTQVTGYSRAEAIGQNPRILHSGKTTKATYDDMWASLTRGETWRGELVNKRKDGSEYIESAVIAPVRRVDGQVSHYLAIKEDITEKRAAEERIQRLAYFDQLTGLPNRVQLDERFRYALSLAQRSGEALAVMFIDLDHFKDINDSLGHSIGDRLLIEIAKRLKAALREEDTVARLGGDEFILVLPGTEADGAATVAAKLIERVAMPYQMDEQELNTTISIGIAVFPADGEDLETLLKNADAALHRVKQANRNSYRFFMPEMQAHSARTLLLLNALHRALERNELQLYYQPQVSLQDGRIVGAEALLRWFHPDLGMISPAEFIPIAEDSGLIVPIGEWVLRTAASQLKDWLTGGMTAMVMAVNLSAVQFRQADLPDRITAILDEFGVAHEHLELELTEAVAMEDPQAAIEMMDRLYERGIRMSIDDFGTGYSSLSYLKKFKVYKLKIDQSFVRNIADDPDDKAIVTAVITLASSLGLHAIAEGVETASQLAFLRLQGCDEVQGYYFSKPLPAAQFKAFMDQRK